MKKYFSGPTKSRALGESPVIARFALANRRPWVIMKWRKGMVENRREKLTKSETNWKLLVCFPSPYTVMGSFLKAWITSRLFQLTYSYQWCFSISVGWEAHGYQITWATKLLTTRPSSMHIRGPYVLKILAILTCRDWRAT